MPVGRSLAARDRSRASQRLAAIGALALLALVAGRAHALSCESTSDCPARFSCATIGQTACAAPPACTGSNCPAAPPCEVKDLKACRSAACARDSDCPDDMVCYGDAGRYSCIPQYLLTCVRASDCGDGFDCVPLAATRCSDAGADADAGDKCPSRTRSEHVCALQRVSCSSAQDCPSRFSCGADPAGASCDDSDAGACTSSGTSTTASQVCLPPYAAIDFDVPQRSPALPQSSGANRWAASSRRGRQSDCAVFSAGSATDGAATHASWGLVALVGGALLVRRRFGARRSLRRG
jgi:hypothetical protein